MPVDEQSRAIFNYMTIRPTFYRFIFFDCRLSGFKQINNKIEKKINSLTLFLLKGLYTRLPNLHNKFIGRPEIESCPILGDVGWRMSTSHSQKNGVQEINRPITKGVHGETLLGFCVLMVSLLNAYIW
jgi:hypothetical protein